MGAVLQERGSDEARAYSDCMTRVKIRFIPYVCQPCHSYLTNSYSRHSHRQ